MLAEGLDELAARAKEGDETALANLYECLRPAMARTVGRCRGPSGWGLLDGEDLLQQGYLILADLLRRWPGQGQFAAWFSRLFPLAILDYRRGFLQWDGPAVESLPPTELVDLVESQAAGSFTEDPTDSLLCGELLALLPESHRQVLRWRYFDGLTFREIERVHGLAATSAQRRCAQALTFLRARALGEDGGRLAERKGRSREGRAGLPQRVACLWALADPAGLLPPREECARAVGLGVDAYETLVSRLRAAGCLRHPRGLAFASRKGRRWRLAVGLTEALRRLASGE